MRQTNVRAGADFVVLTMSIGVVVSFLCAVFNRVFGARYFYVTAVLVVAVRRRLVLSGRHPQS